MKIKILYSHLNVNGTDHKNRPQWFDFEKCFKNLLSTIKNIPKEFCEIELHVIYDVTRGGLEQNWLGNPEKGYKYLATPGYSKLKMFIHQIEGGSMFGAAKEMFKTARELAIDMKDKDLFYFLENDYLHVDGWVGEIKRLFETYNLDGGYVSTYDHLDKYFHPIYSDLVSKILITESHHWRTTPSTCGTYVINKKTFLEDYHIRTTLEGDHNYFTLMAEQKGRFVLSPIPSLSTHCMEGLLAPTIDWKKINN